MSSKVRCFIGIQLNQVTRNKLDKIKNILRDCSLDIKWVEEYNFHITLKFLGEITKQEIENIKEILSKITADKAPFEIRLAKLGAFPNLDYPKTMWVGVKKGSNNLAKLHQEIESELITLGFKKDHHEYTPHITLGRVNRKEKSLDILSQKLREFPFQIQATEVVDRITLIKSRLTPQGPIYEPLAEFELE
ncbi:RNA 2',3'-cyclic phosphodiesterase [Halanaerocella petrolearia]